MVHDHYVYVADVSEEISKCKTYNCCGQRRNRNRTCVCTAAVYTFHLPYNHGVIGMVSLSLHVNGTAIAFFICQLNMLSVILCVCTAAVYIFHLPYNLGVIGVVSLLLHIN